MLDLDVLKAWINDDPFREAVLISEVPIKATTLLQVKSGRYKPSSRMTQRILDVMKSHPVKPARRPKTAAG